MLIRQQARPTGAATVSAPEPRLWVMAPGCLQRSCQDIEPAAACLPHRTLCMPLEDPQHPAGANSQGRLGCTSCPGCASTTMDVQHLHVVLPAFRLPPSARPSRCTECCRSSRCRTAAAAHLKTTLVAGLPPSQLLLMKRHDDDDTHSPTPPPCGRCRRLS